MIDYKQHHDLRKSILESWKAYEALSVNRRPSCLFGSMIRVGDFTPMDTGINVFFWHEDQVKAFQLFLATRGYSINSRTTTDFCGYLKRTRVSIGLKVQLEIHGHLSVMMDLVHPPPATTPNVVFLPDFDVNLLVLCANDDDVTFLGSRSDKHWLVGHEPARRRVEQAMQIKRTRLVVYPPLLVLTIPGYTRTYTEYLQSLFDRITKMIHENWTITNFRGLLLLLDGCPCIQMSCGHVQKLATFVGPHAEECALDGELVIRCTECGVPVPIFYDFQRSLIYWPDSQ